MAEIIDAERNSSNDDSLKLSDKRKRKGKAKAVQSVQSDKEDNDFIGSSSESESEGSELDCVEITNKEVTFCYLTIKYRHI